MSDKSYHCTMSRKMHFYSGLRSYTLALCIKVPSLNPFRVRHDSDKLQISTGDDRSILALKPTSGQPVLRMDCSFASASAVQLVIPRGGVIAVRIWTAVVKLQILDCSQPPLRINVVTAHHYHLPQYSWCFFLSFLSAPSDSGQQFDPHRHIPEFLEILFL